MPANLRIVCFGSSRVGEQDPAWSLSREVGGLLARQGCSVISGGYGGTMEAVSRGAAEAGGRVLGVTTSSFPERNPNSHLDEIFEEPDYLSRMAMLLRAGHGYVALPGALGTLSEWVTAWCLASIGQLGGPLWVFADPWRPVAEAIETLPEATLALRSFVRWVERVEDLESEIQRWKSGLNS